MSGIRWLHADDPAVAEVLAATVCLMTVHDSDPGDAIAFARQGYGVAAPVTSGAHEYVRDLQTYDLLRAHTIHTAVAVANGSPSSIRELPPRPPRRPERPSARPSPVERPLVSVVIPTYNRPDDLRNCLRYVQEQTYRPLECIVVNDAGTNVDDVVAGFPFARVVNLDVNGGVTVAEMTGVRLAKGKYIQLAADDDCIYPDHIERLVFAMERCGAAVGHTNGIIRYQRRLPDRSLRTEGFNARVFIRSTTPAEALVATSISGQGLMWRADVFDEIGPWREDTELADQEVQLRAANRYLFVYVDMMTNEWRVRVGESYATYDTIAEVQKMYAMHPLENRPLIEQLRADTIANVARRPAGAPTFPPSLRFEPGEVRTSS